MQQTEFEIETEAQAGMREYQEASDRLLLRLSKAQKAGRGMRLTADEVDKLALTFSSEIAALTHP